MATYNIDGNATMLSNITDVADDILGQPCHPDNPYFNCSRQRYLEFQQGPQQLPLHQALLVTIIFGGIFITGMLGNVLVCIVIVRHAAMHTATNYYLFSLAVSDLLYLLFGLPVEVFHYWHQYPYLFGLPFCKMRAFISEASSYVSVLTIVAFSMERFLAICHPLHLYTMSGFKRALRIIAALWTISFVSAIPFGLMTDIGYVYYPQDAVRIPDSAFCSTIHIPTHIPIFELSFCVFFVVPMMLIIVLYGKMGAQIRSRTTQQLGVQHGSMHRDSRHQQSRKAIIRMLSAVVITFFICWLPFHVQRLWILHGQDYENFDDINEWMFSVTGFAYYVSCTINPILYNVMSRRYRVAFEDILCGRHRYAHHNNSYARDHSSFHEATTITRAGSSSTYDRVQSIRVRSIRQASGHRHPNSFRSNSSTWKRKSDFALTPQQDLPRDYSARSSSVVVVIDQGANGRPENLITVSNETSI